MQNRVARAVRVLRATARVLLQGSRLSAARLDSDTIDTFVDQAERVYRSIRNPDRRVEALYSEFLEVADMLFSYAEDPDTEVTDKEASVYVKQAQSLAQSLSLAAEVAKARAWLPSDETLDEIATEAQDLIGRMTVSRHKVRELRDAVVNGLRELKLWRAHRSQRWTTAAEAEKAWDQIQGLLEKLRDEVAKAPKHVPLWPM